MTVTNYAWDVESDAYLMETDENYQTTGTYTVEPTPYGRVVSQRRGTDTHWFHYDALGSTRELTDVVQATTDTLLYDAWGSEVARTGSTLLPFRWVGELGYYFDRDSDSSDVRRRVYRPGIARWTSLDLLLVDGLNRFLYVLNNPVHRIDPSGTAVKDCFPTNISVKPPAISESGFTAYIAAIERLGLQNFADIISGIRDCLRREDTSVWSTWTKSEKFAKQRNISKRKGRRGRGGRGGGGRVGGVLFFLITLFECGDLAMAADPFGPSELGNSDKPPTPPSDDPTRGRCECGAILRIFEVTTDWFGTKHSRQIGSHKLEDQHYWVDAADCASLNVDKVREYGTNRRAVTTTICYWLGPYPD